MVGEAGFLTCLFQLYCLSVGIKYAGLVTTRTKRQQSLGQPLNEFQREEGDVAIASLSLSSA